MNVSRSMVFYHVERSDPITTLPLWSPAAPLGACDASYLKNIIKKLIQKMIRRLRDG